MTADAIVEPLRRPRPRPRRHVWRWIVLGLVLLLVAVALWIVARGLIARDQLTGAVPLVEQLKTKIVDGETDGLEPLTEQLQGRAATAAALTSDPIWRAVEIIPWLGPNLTAFREAAAAIDTIASDALPPLMTLAGELDFGDFVPKDGVVDIAAIQSLQPALAEASTAVAAAAEQVRGIDPTGTLPQIGEAVAQLSDVVATANGLVTGINGLVQVLPSMLGADGPRTLLLLVQNNAELRATGGIPGVVIEIKTDGGRIELGVQTTASAMGEFPEPVLPVTDTELQLYSKDIATYMQNVTVTPDFARTGALAAAMWRETYGTTVDGVIAVDPVALSFVLEATGPLTLTDGTALTAQNAVDLLLSEVYFRFERPADQDLFFADAARAVFDATMTYSGRPQDFIEAIARGAGEHRVYVWSAHEDEQAYIGADGSTLATLLPVSDRMAAGFGVYLTDVTMSKVDWYLQPAVSVAGVSCPMWGDHPYYEVRLRLTSTMPPLGEGVPDYVVGPAVGDERGTALTQAYLTLPTGFRVFQTFVDGVDNAVRIVKTDGDYVHYMITSVLPPEATQETVFRIWGTVGAPPRVRLLHTPTAGDFETSIGGALECPTQDEVPTNVEPGIIASGMHS